MSIQELKDKVVRFTEEAWNKGNLSTLDEFLNPDVVSYGSGREELKGIEAYKSRLADFHADYPDFHVDIEEIIAEGDTVADRWTVQGTFTGPGKTVPVPGTGKKFSVKGTWMGRFVDGKIAEDRYTYDTIELARQLGILPEPEEEK